MVVGENENPWGPQVLVTFGLFFHLPTGFFRYPFLTHTQMVVGENPSRQPFLGGLRPPHPTSSPCKRFWGCLVRVPGFRLLASHVLRIWTDIPLQATGDLV